MFDSLSDKVLGSIKKLKGHGKITEDNIKEAIKSDKEYISLNDKFKWNI